MNTCKDWDPGFRYQEDYFGVMGVVLGEVGEIQAYFLAFFHIFDSEVEPEDMASRVGIDPKEEIVFIIADLYHTVQVPAFEPWLKREFFVEVDGRVHPLEGSVVYLILVELIMDHRILSYWVVTWRKLVFLLTFRSLKS